MNAVVPEWNEHHPHTGVHHHHYREYESQALPPHAFLTFLGAGIALLLFLMGGLWHLLGFDAAFLCFLGCCLFTCILFLVRKGHVHVQEMAERKHLMTLARDALANQHSLNYSPATRELKTLSPYTVPNGPLTIKDVTLGGGEGVRELGPGLPIAPSFASIIGQVRPGHLFLGQGREGAIWGDVLDLLSTLNIGRPGMGKSTLLRSVTGQLLEIGGKPMLWDPHGSILDDLGTAFECAESPREIIASGKQLEHLLEHRLDMRRAGKRDFQPLLLIADEMPVISEQVPTSLPVIRRIITEGRKVSMFSILSGVGAPASVIGDTMVRDAMASRYIFLTTPKQANMAGVDTEIAKPLLRQLEEAGPGKAILGRAGYKPELVAIPDTTVEDIRSLVVPQVTPDRLPTDSQVTPTGKVTERLPVDGKQAEVDLEVVELVRELVLAEESQNKIVEIAFPNMRQVQGVKELRRYLAYLAQGVH